MGLKRGKPQATPLVKLSLLYKHALESCTLPSYHLGVTMLFLKVFIQVPPGATKVQSQPSNYALDQSSLSAYLKRKKNKQPS